MAGGCLKPGCVKPRLWFLVLDVCFGVLSWILGSLETGMRANLSIYLFSGVIQICTWVIYGLLCAFVDCVFGSCGAQFARDIAALLHTRVLERLGQFPHADNFWARLGHQYVASLILVDGSCVWAILRFDARFGN